MAARAATAIRSEVSIHLANVSRANATANPESLGTIQLCELLYPLNLISRFVLDCVATNAPRINTDSRRKDANHATVTKVARRASNAINTASARATIMSRVGVAIVARRTNTIVIKDA